MKKRSISNPFMKRFLEGNLSTLLEAVHNDTTLMMELRDKEVKIYYRGRLLVTVKETDEILLCNKTYWKEGSNLNEKPSIKDFVDNIALYKAPIDYYLANVKFYPEEQIKQQLVLENNVIGKYTDKTGDYFILDTECVVKDEDIDENTNEGLDARFDAIALRWPSDNISRQNNRNLGIAFLELKYNERAKTGSAGIEKHIKDYLALIRKNDEFSALCKDLEIVFVQKCKLGLIPAYNKSKDIDKISIDCSESDLIFIFANTDPESISDKKNEWEKIKEAYKNDLGRIIIGKASGFGYGLFRYKNYGKPTQKDLYMKISDYYTKE